MKNNKTESFKFNNPKCLVADEPLDLLMLIHNGELSRVDAWKLLREIHAGEYQCNFGNYGILTVFSLSKDTEQFKKLYEQGCELLDKENLVDPVNEKSYNINVEKLFKPIKSKKINLAKKKKSINLKKSNTKTKNKNA